MRISRRVYFNLAVFLAVSALLIFLGARNLVFQQARGSTLRAELSDASGLRPRNDVTMRGVVVGSVDSVELNDQGTVTAEMVLDPGVEVPRGTIARVVRRSPIGELTVELHPGKGPPLPDGGMLTVDETVPPPDVSRTFEILADLLHEVPSEDLDTVVSELADAVRGRGSDIARFNVDAADLPERILEVRAELESLIRTAPELTGVLADNADTLADDITQTAMLADILRDRRYDLVELSENGGDFLEVAGDLLADEKQNISCLVADFGHVNSVLARPRNIANLIATLEKNHFFFGAVEQAVQVGKDGGTWFRVQLLPHQEPPARSYNPHREPPDVYTANACRSIFGPGVGPVRDRIELAPDSEMHLGR